MRHFVFFTAVLIVSGCGAGISDIHTKLGSGYFYLGEGPTQSYIYRAFDEKDPSIDEISVWPTVLSYDYDKSFVIIKQSPNEKIIRQNLIYFNNETELSADSILKEDMFFNNMLSYDTCYWIITKEDKSVYGPLILSDFLEMKDSLGVSIELDFK